MWRSAVSQNDGSIGLAPNPRVFMRQMCSTSRADVSPSEDEDRGDHSRSATAARFVKVLASKLCLRARERSSE